MKYTCKRCKSNLDITLFFDNLSISEYQYTPNSSIDYIAHATGHGICYACGANINTEFTKLLSSYDIIKLATKGEA